jgi:hypothetical protein
LGVFQQENQAAVVSENRASNACSAVGTVEQAPRPSSGIRGAGPQPNNKAFYYVKVRAQL